MQGSVSGSFLQSRKYASCCAGASRVSRQSTKKNTLNNSSSLIFLTVGQVHPRKGQLAALEALAKLPEDTRNSVEYLVAGPVVDTSLSQLEAMPISGLNEISREIQRLVSCFIFFS